MINYSSLKQRFYSFRDEIGQTRSFSLAGTAYTLTVSTMERLSCLISGFSMIFFCRILCAVQLLLYEINLLCFGVELLSCYVHSLCYDV